MDGAASPVVFWALAAAMTAAALAFVLPRLLARREPTAGPSASVSNLEAHRRALAELDRELAEGRLDSAQHERARLDLERRLLDDLDRVDSPGGRVTAPTQRASRALAWILALAVPLAAFGLYARFGSPDALQAPAGDESLMLRAADPVAQRAELERQVARNPRDGRARVLLARLEMDEGRFADAAQHYERALAVAPKVASDAAVWCEYADALGMAQGRSLIGKPAELIQRALALNAAHPRALEMAGSAAYEQRDYAAAARWWGQLLAQLPPGTPAHDELSAAVERAQQRAQFALPGEVPPTLPPSATRRPPT
jgi:cytochrome c-type biogenesis protein CcmH